jgi:5-formyltetrahydrofolate cyclo-ligase
MLLERRDGTSFDMMKIASQQIHKKLRKNKLFREAKKIGSYYPIGSEVLTQDIMQEILSVGKELFLPKVKGSEMEFRKITDFSCLEKGSFDILEPKDDCPVDNNLDLILVPTIGISQDGVRLGYGLGFFDKFLSQNKITTISLVYEKQVIKKIPRSDHDVLMNWILTEDRLSKVSEIS